MFNIDKKYLYIILGILVVVSLASYINSPVELLSLLLTLPGVIIAITFHEFAHAWMADKLGDNTPRIQGRLNLNPLSHIDPVGFIMLVFAHIGWGKPVQINPKNFNKKRSMSAQEAIVALSGPVMNIIIAIILNIILCCLNKFNKNFILFNQIGFILKIIIEMAITVNIGLGIFNLVPLPPLDGSKILIHFLPPNAKNWFINYQDIFYIIFLVIWISGIINQIIFPVINIVYSGMYEATNWIFNCF